MPCTCNVDPVSTIYFALTSVPFSSVAFLYIVCVSVFPCPNCPYSFLPAVHTVPSSLNNAAELFPKLNSFISSPIKNTPTGRASVIPFPHVP